MNTRSILIQCVCVGPGVTGESRRGEENIARGTYEKKDSSMIFKHYSLCCTWLEVNSLRVHHPGIEISALGDDKRGEHMLPCLLSSGR